MPPYWHTAPGQPDPYVYVRRVDGLKVSLAPIDGLDTPVGRWSVQLGGRVLDAALEVPSGRANTLAEAMAEADRRWPLPGWLAT